MTDCAKCGQPLGTSWMVMAFDIKVCGPCGVAIVLAHEEGIERSQQLLADLEAGICEICHRETTGSGWCRRCEDSDANALDDSHQAWRDRAWDGRS